MVKEKGNCNWSDEAFHSLLCAIINSTESDWDLHARSINRKGCNQKDLYQLKQIIDFIHSDWFRDLTNHSCSQDKAVDLLMERIKNQKAKEELENFRTINRKKWFSKHKPFKKKNG